jgi:hypothetical protein
MFVTVSLLLAAACLLPAAGKLLGHPKIVSPSGFGVTSGNWPLAQPLRVGHGVL